MCVKEKWDPLGFSINIISLWKPSLGPRWAWVPLLYVLRAPFGSVIMHLLAERSVATCEVQM